MKIQTTKNQFKNIPLLQSAAIISVLGLFLFGIIHANFASADQYEAQIQALSQDSGNKKNQQAQLGAEAASLGDTIAKLQAEINAMQAKINDNQAKVNDLNKQIAAAELELAKQKNLLGENIKQMYIDGDISTLEMLASSKNLSDFFDKQQYRESVRSKIKTTLDKITQLKLDLSTQKDTAEKLIAEQKTLQGNLAAQRAENDRLLGLNQSQQGELDSQIKSNSAKISQLRAQQAAENAKLFKGVRVIAGSNGRDTYPTNWRNAPQDSLLDNWGMYNRECVSYVAWKVYESGRFMPYWGGRGNANQWDDNARSAGIPVDSTPRAGSAAVSNSGYYGHIMWVESVNPNGTINVSQYNWGLDGRYSEAYNLSPAGLVFIHF